MNNILTNFTLVVVCVTMLAIFWVMVDIYSRSQNNRDPAKWMKWWGEWWAKIQRDSIGGSRHHPPPPPRPFTPFHAPPVHYHPTITPPKKYKSNPGISTPSSDIEVITQVM